MRKYLISIDSKMVVVSVTRGSREQTPERFDVDGQTYLEIQNNLTQAGVPLGIFYLRNPANPAS